MYPYSSSNLGRFYYPLCFALVYVRVYSQEQGVPHENNKWNKLKYTESPLIAFHYHNKTCPLKAAAPTCQGQVLTLRTPGFYAWP